MQTKLNEWIEEAFVFLETRRLMIWNDVNAGLSRKSGSFPLLR
jgi:hypothetical protein